MEWVSDQDYDTAIRYASRVKEDYADFGKAISLLLECYASQGDIVKVVECINDNVGNNLYCCGA